MPIPKPEPNEDKQKFVARCMGNETMKKDYPDNKQRVAICLGQTRKSKADLLEEVQEIIHYSSEDDCEECGFVEELTQANLIIPEDKEYIDVGEEVEAFDLSTLSQYKYMDPSTREYFYFRTPGIKKKDDKTLVFISEASEYQGRKVQLNKPFRTPDGPKKFSVYVKNEKGNVVKVNFGDPNMEIKKDIPARRKSFRARMRCDSPGPKWKARYWACKSW